MIDSSTWTSEFFTRNGISPIICSRTTAWQCRYVLCTKTAIKKSDLCNANRQTPRRTRSYHMLMNFRITRFSNCRRETWSGCDPGKYSMVYMADSTSKLRCNAFQRRTESLAKKNSKILQTEKIKHGIHSFESVLSEKNSKTIDIERFRGNLPVKNKLNSQVRPFY